MQIEDDTAEIISGVRNGKTLGTPVSFLIRNRDYDNWQEIMGSGPCPQAEAKAVYRPRPGHADLAGAMKYDHRDMRNVLERASARETAARVAAGAFFRQFLEAFDIHLLSQVVSIAGIRAQTGPIDFSRWQEHYEKVEASPVRCADTRAEQEMVALIDRARQEGESLGGSFELGAVGVPPGLGSHTGWESRLDTAIAAALMSIPAVKAVEIGEGIKGAENPGSRVHDEILYDQQRGLYRESNNAGGIEGGVSNGEPVWARAYIKPIPTLYKPLRSVDTRAWKPEKAAVERSDICVVPAAAVVGEAMLAFVLASAFLDKFGGDSMAELQDAYQGYGEYLKKVWQWEKTLY